MRQYFEAYQHMNKEKNEDRDNRDSHDIENCGQEDSIYQSFEAYRVSRPTGSFRVMLLIWHHLFFGLIPITVLLYLGKVLRRMRSMNSARCLYFCFLPIFLSQKIVPSFSYL